MKTTNIYSKAMMGQLKSLRHDLDILKAKAGEDLSLKDEMHTVIDELEEKFNALEGRLQNSALDERELWPNFRSSVERAWKDVRVAIDHARLQYLH